MKRMLCFAALAVASLASSLAFAANDDAASILKHYEDNAKLFAIGMCDSDQSTLTILAGTGYRVIRFNPVADASKQFYVITKQNGPYWLFEDHFIKDLSQNASPDEENGEQVRQVSHYALSVEVKRLSDNFYPWVRGSSIDRSDCDVSVVEPQ